MSSISNEMEEYLHWRSVRATVLKYRDMSYFDIDRRRRRLTKLIDTNPLYKTMLAPDIVDGKHLRSLEEAIDINQDFLDALIDYHDDCGFAPSKPNSNSNDNSNDDDDININFSSGQHRNHAILHSFYREWSEEGKDERESCFDPIIQELASHFNPIGIPYQKRILVPGCGLARLPLEIVRLGLCCEGNEFSAYMCVGSNFVLNGLVDDERFTIYPWLDRVCNVVNNNDVLQGVMVPDKNATDILADSEYYNINCDTNPYPRFSMSTGDFMAVYDSPENQGTWDGVVTCFFIDTAPIILEYISTIHKILRTGGIWVNNGPLLYHWVDDSEGTNDHRYGQSIALSWEDVKHSIQAFGFTIIKEERKVCNYTHFKTSMISTVYNTVLFTAIKN